MKMKLFLLIVISLLTTQAGFAQSGLPDLRKIVDADLSTAIGKEGRISAYTMTLVPGFFNEKEHRHLADIFGYVLEGKIEMMMEDSVSITYGSGEIFRERHNELHRIYRNPSQTDTTKVLMIFINN